MLIYLTIRMKMMNEHELKQLIERRDLNFEIAGLEVGRIRRFLDVNDVDNGKSERKKSERAALTALQLMLLNDLEYAALRARVENTLAKADTRLAELHLKAEEMFADSTAELEALEARAGELSDGTKVFRSAYGDVFTADGRALDAEERADVSWMSDAPSFEEYSAAKEAHAEIVGYQDAINSAQGQVDRGKITLETDQDGPTSAEDLEALENSIQADLERVEELRTSITDGPDTDQSLAQQFNTASPDLDGFLPPEVGASDGAALRPQSLSQ